MDAPPVAVFNFMRRLPKSQFPQCHMVEEQTQPSFPDGTRAPPKHHGILVLVTANPKTAMVVRRAKRISDFLEAECFAVAVQPSGDLTGLSETDRVAVEGHLNFARNLHIETRILEGDDLALTLIDFAHRNEITQMFLTLPTRKPWRPVFSRDSVQRVISLAKDMQIVIVSDREPVAR